MSAARPRPPRRWEWLALAAILLVAALLRGVHPGADVPWEAERTAAPLLDAYWYLEAAAGPVDGSHPPPEERARGYEVPVWTQAARVWLWALGPSHAAAALLGGAVGVLAVAFTWRVLRAPLGPRGALAGAAALATLYPTVALDRTALIYGPVTLLLLVAAALWLRGGTQRGAARAAHELSAWALVLAAAALVRPPALALAGGLLLGQAARAGRAGRLALLTIAALGLAAAAALAAEPALQEATLAALRARGGLLAATADRLGRYLAGAPGPGDLVVRLFAWGAEPGGPLGGREGLWQWGSGYAALAPLTLAVAAVGVGAAAEAWSRLPRASREAALVLGGWGLAFLLGAALVAYRPLRYFALLGPPLAAAVGCAVAWAGGWGPFARAGERPARRSLRSLAAAAALGAAGWTHLVAATATSPRAERLLIAAGEGAALGLTLWTVATVLGGRRRKPSPRRPRVGLALGLLLAALGPSAHRAWTRVIAAPSWTTLEAARVTHAALAPDALLVGPYASLLALGSGRERRHGWWIDTRERALPATLRRLRRLGATHLALDEEQQRGAGLARRFAEAGAPLHRVAVLELERPGPVGRRGRSTVLVYRFPWSAELGYRPSAFERGEQVPDPVLRRARAAAQQGSF